MTTTKTFPPRREGRLFLTDGGIETEIMYKWGFELPHFAMYPLLDDADAMAAVRGMYRRYLDVVARHRLSALMGGLDYRASPDWGALLGYSREGLAEANLRSIAFLRELAAEYADDIAQILIAGYVGPRGDAYKVNRTITARRGRGLSRGAARDAAGGRRRPRLGAHLQQHTGGDRGRARGGRDRGAARDLVHARRRLAAQLRAVPGGRDRDRRGGDRRSSARLLHAQLLPPRRVRARAVDPGGWIERVRGFRPNASRMDKIALCKLGHLEEGDPVELGRLMGALARRYPHMDVWGGCCGTGDVHLDEIARNLVVARRGSAAAPAGEAAAVPGHA